MQVQNDFKEVITILKDRLRSDGSIVLDTKASLALVSFLETANTHIIEQAKTITLLQEFDNDRAQNQVQDGV